MKSKSSLILALFLFLALGSKSQGASEDVVIGKYHILNSETLGEDRKVAVHLPRGYEETKLDYPIVYLLYGDCLDTYFVELISILEGLNYRNLAPQMILVGVHNTDRYRDLLPLEKNGNYEGVENFHTFLTTELMPFINKQYRTADYNILIGPQAGSCFGMYALMNHPATFNAILIESGSFTPPMIRDYMTKKATTFFSDQNTLDHFLYVKLENQFTPSYEYTKSLIRLIESKQPKAFRLGFHLHDIAQNNLRSLPGEKGLCALFEGYSLAADYPVNCLKDIQSYYDTLSTDLGFTLNTSDVTLMMEGDKLDQDGKSTEAMEVYEFILELYPTSLAGLHRAAEKNISLGRYQKAKGYLQRFLAINPDEVYIKERLQVVEKLINQ